MRFCLAPFAALAALVFLSPSGLRGDGPVDYLREVKPLLAEKCLTCHGALKQKGDLRLDTIKSMREGGEHGPAIVPGQGEQSLLMERVLGRNGARRMPPASEGEPLTERQLSLVKRWIDQGAPGPADEKPEADPREHWAFQPPKRPPVPAVKHQAFARNPIDAFIAAEWEGRGLIPQGHTDGRTLLRRVYLDLIGLPPTAAEQDAFLEASARHPDSALEDVVDRLLASPQYGERWGRHWMDIWRYSDSWGLGKEVRNSQKHLWHWRDWVVQSLNADRGYDQMVREMLAADELYPVDLDRLRATGFLARHYFRFNRSTWLDETVEHTAKAFLGVTLNCAKCHDHKYDPFAQADYYRFRAFFEPYQLRTEQLPGEADYEKAGIPRAYDCNLETPTYLFVRGDDRNPSKDRLLSPGLPTILTWEPLEIRPVTLPTLAHTPGLRPYVLEDCLRWEEQKSEAAWSMLEQAHRVPTGAPASAWKVLADRVRAAAEAEVAEKILSAAEMQVAGLKARAAADRSGPQPPAALARRAAEAECRAFVGSCEEALARAELNWLKADTKTKPDADVARRVARGALIKARKEWEDPGERYTPLGALKTPESNVETDADRRRPFPRTSTGRRSALAAWMTDRRNPLTARVAVNHIWARHFGRPLVDTVFDLGRKGSPPSHPGLLDYLSVEFMDHGWSMKHLHRLIVTSGVYRLTSSSAGADARTREIDPENRYCWRRNPQRMEAQVLRDSLLHLAGELDPKMGGPSVPVAEEASRRRSLYFVHSHNEQQKFLGTFDDASVRECYRRTESIVPQQALALANSKLALDMAARISERLHRKLGQVDDAEFSRAAFVAVLASAPNVAELAACEEALREWRGLAAGAADTDSRARAYLVHALLNHNDFITIR